MSLRRSFALAIALAGTALTTALPAEACGGLFCARIPVDQSGEKILFATDGHTVTAHVQIQYKGDAQKFSWIVPVPTPPKLGVGSDTLFARLRQATQPQFQLDIHDEGPCAPPPLEPMMRYKSAPSSAMAGRGAVEHSVHIVSQEQVGPYDTVVLQANEPGVLKAWLRKNDYVIPPKLDPLLDPYVAAKYSFVALKLTKNRSAGDIQPIVMTYKATKPGIPLRLTGVAATNDMDIYVWVLGAHRAVPENFRHMKINEARINWESGGDNYKDVVTHAVDEAGGQAFVTDYAGPADVVSAEDFSREHYKLDALAKQTDPVLFAQAIVDDGYFGERYGALNQDALVAFLKKYIRKPHSLHELSDMEFYRFINDHAEALHEAGIQVDAARAAAELDQKVVKPSAEIGKMLKQYPYMTALYTAMSPPEMTQDPTFRFNTSLGDVAAVRHAEGIRHCRKDLPYWQSPIEIKLANGQHFMAPPEGGRYYYQRGRVSELPNLPAAETIEQLTPQGPGSTIQDNTAAIAQVLAEADKPAPLHDDGRRWAAGVGTAAWLLVMGGLRLRRRKR